jgi:hypothetical protein
MQCSTKGAGAPGPLTSGRVAARKIPARGGFMLTCVSFENPSWLACTRTLALGRSWLNRSKFGEVSRAITSSNANILAPLHSRTVPLHRLW